MALPHLDIRRATTSCQLVWGIEEYIYIERTYSALSFLLIEGAFDKVNFQSHPTIETNSWNAKILF